MRFSRQEYWSGLPFPPSGDLRNPGIEPASPADPALQADSLPLSHPGSPKMVHIKKKKKKKSFLKKEAPPKKNKINKIFLKIKKEAHSLTSGWGGVPQSP